MKRISNLFLCLMLAASAASLAQDNKTVSGRVISSSAFELVLQTDAGTRLNLVVDSATTKPAILSEGDQVTVVYRPLDAGGFQAVQVLSGTEKTAPAQAGTPNRTLTNTAPPGTEGQTGTSRTTVVGTTGNFNAPASPPQPSKPMDSTETTIATEPMKSTPATTPMNDTDTMDHSMANDTTAATTATDTTATNDNNDNTAYGDSLPQTASPEPEILVLGLLALGAAALLMRRRSTVR